uniref:Uncharacterized protein n=1 Tax=Knipowitschia caucasica TaxID=637954 RepID=A0AAV2LGG6_KNICA
MAPSEASSMYFGFEEFLPVVAAGPAQPRNNLQHSKEPVTLAEKLEQELSPPEDEYCIPPGYEEVSEAFDNKGVHNKATILIFEMPDTEAYFDCKQGASDFSETESEEPEIKSGSSYQSCNDPMKSQRSFPLLPSESEEYEDSAFPYEPLSLVQEEDGESSEDEFTLCEAPPPNTTVCEYDNDDTNETIWREIEAGLGKLSESSDEEFLTTRIIRRRFIMKADEMDDVPPQSVSEESYVDENGHTVVKKITRKVIRRYASSDAVLEQDSSEEGAQASIRGDGYSQVLQRTIVKSEGDQSEVTFTECVGSSKSDKAEMGGVSCVEYERTVTLASDIPSAQDDFRQDLGYISYGVNGVNGTELPPVVERQTAREDGTVVRRSQTCKSHSLRRTVVKGAEEKQLLKRAKGPRKGSRSTALKQHLHQLFHQHHDQTHGQAPDSEGQETH